MKLSTPVVLVEIVDPSIATSLSSSLPVTVILSSMLGAFGPVMFPALSFTHT